MKPFLLFVALCLLTHTSRSQTSYTWNGSVSASWNTANNWTPNGIPGAADNITIVTAGNACLLSANTTITNFKLTSGVLDLGGSTLTIAGANAVFTTGTVQNGNLSITAATTTTFGNGPVTVNGGITITSAAITIKNTTFQGPTTITKTGATNDASSGSNIFNGAVTFTNAGSGYLMMGNGNPDQFNNTATFNNTGSSNIYVAHNSAGNTFNNIVVTSNGGQGVQFCAGSTTATATLAAGNTITIGAAGFSTGTLQLRQFTQSGTTAQNLALTGTGSLSFGPSSVFGGAITTTSPGLLLNGGTFNGATNFTKTGSSGDFGAGGNIFNGICSITNSGSSYLVLGNSNPDTWNNDVTFTDNGSERLLPCWGTTGNLFNGNIYVNTAGSAQGIQFCGGNNTATTTLAAGKTIQAGTPGLTAGYLYLKQFTQNGTTPITLTGTGTAVLYLGPSSSFGGAVTATAPDIWAQGATYNGAASFTKTGGSSNHNNQFQNIFNSTCTINQQSNTGYFMLGYNSNDLFNDNIILSSVGTGGIYLGWTSGTGTPTLTAGKSIQVGAAGFSAGFLYLNTFTQAGTAPINLNFTGTNTQIYFANNTVIGGNLTVSAPDIYLQSTTFNGATNCTKTGVYGDFSAGGNIFNGVSSITNSGAGYMVLGSTNPDTWNNDVTFTDNGSERLLPCWSSTGNQFNGNIYVNTAGSATGIQFCGGNTTATALLSAGKTIQAGSVGLTAGYLILKQFNQAGNAPVNLTVSNTGTYLQFGPGSALGGNVVSSSPGLYFNGCTFNGTVNSTKTGASNDAGTGTNSFNGVTTLTNAGSGYLLLGNGNADQFNTTATFNNTGSSNMYLAYNSANNVFAGLTTFNNNPTANTLIYVSSYSTGTSFTNNIVVSSTNGQGVQFCGSNTTATATLSAGNTISIGSGGFSSGQLLLKQFTQTGATPQNLTLTGTGALVFGPSSAFGGDLSASSPTLYLNGCTFNGVTSLTKTGASGDFSTGGNIFNGISTITNSGGSYLVLGNTAPDTWNNDVTFTDNGSERLLPCWATTGNQFNGNIFVNTAGSAQGIQFCGGNNTATATLAAGKTIQSGTTGLNAGYLILKQFTQSGNTPVSLTLGSTATYLQFGPASSFGGNIVSSSPGLLFNGCTFNGTVTSTKTGASNDQSSGSNIFNGVTALTNAGTGYLMLGNGNADQFITTATFNNTGSNNIYVANNSPNNVFGGLTTFNNTPTANTAIYVSPNSSGTSFSGNIVVSSNNGQGVQFCTAAGASATLTAGNTISIGPGGFSAGTLLLKQFTQTGATAQNLTLTGTGNLTFGPAASFAGDLTTVSPTLFFNGGVFTGIVNATKNGSTSDGSAGNNFFFGPFTVTNTGAGYFLMGNGNPDVWQSTATFNNLSSAQHMWVAYNSTGNTFNGNVNFNNQPGSTGLWIYPNNNGINTQFNGNITVTNINGGGVYFGSGGGNATLASGGAITAGAGGFNTGGLIFKNFAQTSAGVTQNITTTGSSYIQYGAAASFAGPVTSSSPGLFFNGCTFNAAVNCTKTGSSNDQSQGGNTFNAPSTFTDNGTGYLLMTASAADAYNSDVTFVKNGTGPVYPNYNNSTNYAGNLTVTSPAAAITFGSNTGTATFSGAAGQSISATPGTQTPVFTRLVINTTGSGVTLSNTGINVSGNLTLTAGLLNTSTSYILTMLNGSTTAAGTTLSTSYVNGPMRYQKSSAGASTLNFPVGTAPDCRPIILTVNHTNSTLYTYQTQLFNASASALNYTLPPSVSWVSHVHYYTIGRTDAAGTTQPVAGLSGNQQIQIFFSDDDGVQDGSTLTIVKNTYTAPTSWIDIGGMGGPAASGGANLTGSIISTSGPTPFNSFSTFAIANKIGSSNTLPIQLLFFDAKPDNNQVDLSWETATESNNSYFTVEKSKDGTTFEFVTRVNSAAFGGNSSDPLNYTAYDLTPYQGTSFYRLKQTDLDGNSKYSNIIPVNFSRQSPVSVYPNPSPGTVYVSGLPADQASLKVEWYDIGGRLLQQQMASAQGGLVRLDTRFNNGVYVLKFETADGTVIVKNVLIMK